MKTDEDAAVKLYHILWETVKHHEAEFHHTVLRGFLASGHDQRAIKTFHFMKTRGMKVPTPTRKRLNDGPFMRRAQSAGTATEQITKGL